ncbi:MAG: SMC-Scp complex subunit ScpB [Candidatus Hodarchaeota archaeon]
MNNFNEDLDENSKEDNEDHLDQESKEESNDLSNEEIDEIPKIQSQGSATKGTSEEIIDDIISKSEIDAQIGFSSKSDLSEEDMLVRQLRDFHRNQIEASLYVAGRPLSIEELSTKLEIKKKEVEELINEIAFDYLDRSTALVIAQIGDSYQMQIKPEYAEKVSKLAKGGAIAERYLRTLTIIALKQPILKSLVVKIRGSGAYEHIKYLQDNGLIAAVKKGRTHELTTTDKYSEMFGLPKDIEELKRVMISQLGLDEVESGDEISYEIEVPAEDNVFSEDEESSENEENTQE